MNAKLPLNLPVHLQSQHFNNSQAVTIFCHFDNNAAISNKLYNTLTLKSLLRQSKT